MTSYYLNPSESAHLTVGDTAATFDLVLAVGGFYRLSVTTACYVRPTTSQGDDASAGAGSMLLHAGEVIHFQRRIGDPNDRISIVRAAEDGAATLSRVL